MKAIPAVVVFFMVYYLLWLAALPVRIFRQFVTALAGNE
jgi:hypothetical protein